MVTFRFYVVATVALFLALAIGIVIGSALNDTIVSSLKQSITRVEANLDDSVAAMEKRKRQIDQLDRFIEDSAPYAVDGRLAGTTTLLLVEPGAASAQVDELVRSLRQADSSVEAVLWLDPRWDLDDASDRKRLADVTDTADAGTPSARRRAAWDAVMAEVGEQAGAGDGGVVEGEAPTTTVPPPVVPVERLPLVQALAEAGFLRVEAVDAEDDSTEAGGEVVVATVTSPVAELDEPGVEGVEVASAAAAAGLPSVVTEAFDPGEQERERGTTLGSLREASPAGISTVDDLDLVAGRVGTVLALAELRAERNGHYGYGPGVDRVLPEWAAN